MAKKPKIATRGALIVLDLAAVDCVWSGMPAREAVEGIRTGSLAPRIPSRPAPAPAAERPARGLDVALAAFTSRALQDCTLAESLRAKRALGIPWRWLTHVPDAREEARTDERLLRWAEVGRVADLTADEILAVTSAAEREMAGAAEVKAAFARWATPAFAEKLAELRDEDVPAALVEAWDDTAPLLALLGHDDEAELFAAVGARVSEVRAMLAFAKAEGLDVLPFLRGPFDELLAARAAARASHRDHG